jgi:hypothetical protein
LNFIVLLDGDSYVTFCEILSPTRRVQQSRHTIPHLYVGDYAFLALALFSHFSFPNLPVPNYSSLFLYQILVLRDRSGGSELVRQTWQMQLPSTRVSSRVRCPQRLECLCNKSHG